MNISGSDYTSVEDLEAANGYDWCQTICDDLKVKATVPKNCPNLQYKDAYFFDGKQFAFVVICFYIPNVIFDRLCVLRTCFFKQ